MIKRLVALISSQATLEAEKEAAMKQAASASRAAEALLDSGAKPTNKSASGDTKDLEKELVETREGTDASFGLA